jgi:hypothetical protein|tara:strand:+ start:166 stop:474 length:309 start_codon:yes stop_codon:yes gene_type:complete
MKKIFLFFAVIFLIVTTTLTKNSTKKLENQIFTTKENISILKDKYELVLLDYNYLTSPKKLLDYQSQYFEKELTNVDINDIKELIVNKEKIIIQDFNQLNNE